MNNFFKKKTVLVTGANGFLGSHLTVALLERGARVVGAVKVDPPRSYLRLTLKERGSRGYSQVRCDIAHARAVEKLFRKYRPALCLHVAAQPIVGIANKSPVPTLETNIAGTWNILECCRVHGVRSTVVASSDKAYGEHKTLPYTEEASLLALHPYDASKACTDILARVYAHTYALPTAVTRCANIYGPGDFNFSRIIPDSIRSLDKGEAPRIRSDGTPLRDYVYVEDIVEAYLLLAQRLYEGKVAAGEAFNFGTGTPVSVLSLVHTIRHLMKRLDLAPVVLSKRKIKGEIDRQYLSSRKALRVLGWRPRYSLREGLRETIDWYCRKGVL